MTEELKILGYILYGVVGTGIALAGYREFKKECYGIRNPWYLELFTMTGISILWPLLIAKAIFDIIKGK